MGVASDDDEDIIDDIENKFNFVCKGRQDRQYSAESMLQGQMSDGRGGDVGIPHVVHTVPNVPVLTNSQMVDDIPPEQNALVLAFVGGGGKQIHPLPFAYPSIPMHPRSMDPSKDLAVYGYGSMAWKERMESWKQKQEELQVTRNDSGGKDWDNDGDGPDLPLQKIRTGMLLLLMDLRACRL